MSLIGSVLKNLGISDKDLPKRDLKDWFSEAKNRSLEPEKYIADHPGLDQAVYKVFKGYQQMCIRDRSQRLPEVGGIFVQGEDELCSICLLYTSRCV